MGIQHELIPRIEPRIEESLTDALADPLSVDVLRELMNPETKHGPKAEGLGLASARLVRVLKSRIEGGDRKLNLDTFTDYDLALALADAVKINRCASTDQLKQFGEMMLECFAEAASFSLAELFNIKSSVAHRIN